jgi:hypothetical protein
MLFVFIFYLIFILSCSKGSKNIPAGELLKAEREFSEMAVIPMGYVAHW